LLLLQNASFLPMFRQSMQGRGRVREFAVDRMEPLEPEASGEAAVAEIFAAVGRDPMTAARKTLAYVDQGRPLAPWIEEARRLVLLKGTGAHDYKFACAALEDATHVSDAWRARYLASAVFSLQGSAQGDNPLVARIRAALAGQ
jgi:hypothetical protein